MLFDVINGQWLQTDESDETLIQFKALWIGKISYDYDSEYGMTVAWAMAMAMTSILFDQ